MILKSMSSLEISNHIRSEYESIKKRIRGRVHIECKTLSRKKRSTLTFVERTKNLTEFTIYITNSELELHTTGSWFESSRGKMIGVARWSSIMFISGHFFERYAERFITKVVPVKEAAKHFFYNNNFQGMYCGPLFATEDRENQFAVVYEQGVALGNWVGENDSSVNTFIGNDMLFERQQQLAQRIRSESDNGRKVVILTHDDENEELRSAGFTHHEILTSKINEQ